MIAAVADAPEKYLTGRELVELMGISLSTLKRWNREGCPSHDWGMRRTRLYLLSEMVPWAEQRARMARPARDCGTDGNPTEEE